ncbi:hypothetical protein [Lactobacillus ultunensis]|uniref:Uncharacterized protein n=1 Tax=Lactobacillus ultunensis DSM 16047 TaxID=525365 RepID=C2ELF2_9LACO|nr:hypothetical protein [Lactobacillus ultunensis]EEJ72600.1 hypothetical protein HMPREF0548_0498 [Lactobacillus ultunensis DSM 16047]KRL81257.1 hypothetical protein FC57_GL000788 [Lactobacillus ultunensis DSM 16047]QQP28201.1 hypothetical protein H4B44_08865 [Lactobacillus ultunensis]
MLEKQKKQESKSPKEPKQWTRDTKEYWIALIGLHLYAAFQVGLAIYFANMHTDVGDAGAALMGGTTFITLCLTWCLFF